MDSVAAERSWGQRRGALEFAALLMMVGCSGDLPSELLGKSADAFIWTEEQKLAAGNGTEGDEFGFSVAHHGNIAFVGATHDDGNLPNTGSAYVFVRSATTWAERQRLTASDGEQGDSFGNSLSPEGDSVVVGARWDNHDGHNSAGSVYVFVRRASLWTQDQKLTASDAEPGDHFGYSLLLDGDTALVSAIWDDDNGNGSGSAYVFVRSGSAWTEQQKLTASDGRPAHAFGSSTALEGDTALVGAYGDDGGAGSAYVFVHIGGEWTEMQKLTAGDRAAGDSFGYSLSRDGDTVLVGAHCDDDNGQESGSVYVFVRNGSTWSERQKLAASDGWKDDNFGRSVSLHGDRALLGSVGDNDSWGAAYVFVRSGGVWVEAQKLTASDGAQGDELGISVALAADTALVGAHGDDDQGNDSGAAYVFALRKEDGAPCAEGDECATAYCADSVCCDDPCGGNSPDDCRACSIAAGASTDGVCGDVDNGADCDDGLFCTADDSCLGGTCIGSGDPCPGPDEDANCSESCDEDERNCMQYDGDDAPCKDGTCRDGTCEPTPSSEDLPLVPPLGADQNVGGYACRWHAPARRLPYGSGLALLGLALWCWRVGRRPQGARAGRAAPR